jgi:hypothetical protein
MIKTPDQIEAAEAEIRDQQAVIDYTVREYPVEVIVSKHSTGEEEGTNEIFVPEYQRDLVWDDRRQSKFIESLLIGLPIPYLFVADVGSDDPDNSGRLEIVDGTQRIRTLARFVNNKLRLEALTKLPALNGFVFSELPLPRQRRFNRITLRMIELTEKADEETRRDMFDRINTGSVMLNTMESRRGRMPGLFVDLIKELAATPLFHTLAPMNDATEKRFEREELVARFFAFRDGVEDYGKTKAGTVVSDFVDNYTQEKNAEFAAGNDALINEYRKSWADMLEFVRDYFPYGFKKTIKSKSTPRVRFDAIAVGSALALTKQSPPQGADNVSEWLTSPEFNVLTSSDAANNRSRVQKRIFFVRDRLLAQ